MNLFSHQTGAYCELLARAQTYFAGQWQQMPINTRWHSLIIGPTGTGKSMMANILCNATNATLFRISAPTWMPAGAHDRATSQTLPMLLRHIESNTRTVLFIDELEKINTADSPWLTYIRQELYEILDGRWNKGLKPEDSNDEEDPVPSNEHLSAHKLRTTTFILAACTFQTHYDTQNRVPVGFHSNNCSLPKNNLTADQIAERIPRELVNRFHSRLILLPDLSPNQYHELAMQAEASLPGWIVPGFRVAAAARIPHAIASKSGCRFIEESLADALMARQREQSTTPNLILTCPEYSPC